MPSQERRTYGSVPKRRVEVLLGALIAYANEDFAGVLRGSFSRKLDLRSRSDRCLVIKASMAALIELAGRYEQEYEHRAEEDRTIGDRTQVNEALFHLENTLNVLEDNRVQQNESPHFTLRLWHPYRGRQRNLDEIENLWPRKFKSSRGAIEPPRQRLESAGLWWENSLQPLNFSAFLAEKRKFFTGREWLFDEIESRFTQSGEQVLLLTGDPGSGKTALLAEFMNRVPGDRVLAYHCCQADNEQTLSPGKFVRSVAGMVANKLEDYAKCLTNPLVEEVLSEENCDLNPAAALEDGLLNSLQLLNHKDGDIRYILIDGLDESLTRFRDKLNRTIAGILTSRLSRLPSWIRILATTRCDADILLRFGCMGRAEIRADDDRNLQDIDDFVEYRIHHTRLADLLRQSGKTLEFVKETLRHKGNGNILYVRQALEGIENGRYSFEQLDLLPPGLSGLYFEFFERLFPDRQSFEVVKTVLQVVAAAQEPLTDAQLAEVTLLELDEELYPLLRQLAVYLPVREGPNGQQRFTFYHKSLTDWLTGQGLRGTP